ncbi:hypothetical protein PAXINDRAFT_88972, partial [Paxillus involutus ATCC 200175]
LFDIASGLRYLHSQGVVHGDLHSVRLLLGRVRKIVDLPQQENVLVDDNGKACLTDFGLSLIIQDFVGTSYLKSNVCGAVRYTDPELVRKLETQVDGSVVHPTKPSDIYSFGGLMLHVLTGKRPYDPIREIHVAGIVARGERPELPVDERISPQHESLIERCWSPQESTRPSAEDIMTLLQVISDV